MVMADDSWYVVRNTPGVTGFVGAGNRPVPLEPEEVQAILRQMGYREPRPGSPYSVGDTVRVISGPFANFSGDGGRGEHGAGPVAGRRLHVRS